MRLSKKFFRHREAAKVVSIYILFGFLWIYFSDTIVGWLVHDEKIITLISIFKGFFFIVFTSCLLFFLIVRLQNKINQSTDELRKSEERFRFLVKNSSDSLVIINADGSQRYVSPASERITGFPVSELEGRPLNTIVHPDDIAKVMTAWDEVIKNPEKVITVQYRHIHKTAGWVYSEAIAQSFLDEPAINGVIASVRDITKHKQSEEAINNAKIILQTVIDAVPCRIFYKDLELKYLGCNIAFARDAGVEHPRNLIGKDDYQLAWLEQSELYRSDDKLVINSGSPKLSFEEPQTTPEGNTIWLRTSKVPLRNKSNDIIGVVGVYEDITKEKESADLLRLRESYLSAIIENQPGLIWLKDTKGKFLTVNAEFAKSCGLDDPQLLIGKTDLDIWPKDLAEKYISDDEKVLRSKKSLIQEEVIFDKDQIRWFETFKTPVTDNQKIVIGSTGYARDITDSKRAEDELKSNYALLQIAGETAKFGGWSVDLEKNICTWSDAVADIHEVPHGYSPPVQEAINFYAPKWREKITQCFSACVKEGNSYDEELVIITQKGKHVWVRATGKAVKNEKDKIIKVQGSFQDITDKKQAEEALRESEEKLQALFSAMTEMVVVHELLFDEKGIPCNYRILDCNQAFCRITKIKKETAVGKTATQVYNTDSAPYLDVFARVAQSGEPDEFVTYYASMDKHFLVSVVSPRKNFFATITSDITEIMGAEAEREKLQAQLNQAQKMESVGRLAGGVAHDFNNMLGVIFGHTEMALQDVDPSAPLYASLQTIHQAAERSAALTRQLLAFARKQTVAPKVIDLNETVEGMLNMLRRLIGEDIDLLWRPGANLLPVKIDPAQIDHILANLCVNARDAITEHGKITIETDRKTFDAAYCADHLGFLPGEYLLLEVSDDGCGMDRETLSHIFEPFFTTKEQGKGTGLGLASVFGMVKQNNGYIHVESEPGHGTTFKIYLPAFASKSARLTEKEQEKPAECGHETVLLVEDEPAILQMTTMMLTRLGYTVVAAPTPGEAIRLAHEYKGRIDLLMTDVVMPEMNGRELAANLLCHYPNLKRLFMSGYTADIIAHQGVLDESVHFIQKPFSMKDLATKIREALDRK